MDLTRLLYTLQKKEDHKPLILAAIIFAAVFSLALALQALLRPLRPAQVLLAAAPALAYALVTFGLFRTGRITFYRRLQRSALALLACACFLYAPLPGLLPVLVTVCVLLAAGSACCSWLCPLGGLLELPAFLSGKQGKAFCRSLCPLGALLRLTAPAHPLRVKITAENCAGCDGSCRPLCPANAIDGGSAVSSGCLRCLGCLEQCRGTAVETSPAAPLAITLLLLLCGTCAALLLQFSVG